MLGITDFGLRNRDDLVALRAGNWALGIIKAKVGEKRGFNNRIWDEMFFGCTNASIPRLSTETTSRFLISLILFCVVLLKRAKA